MRIFADRELEALTLLYTVCQAKAYATNAWERGKDELEALQRGKCRNDVRIDSLKKQMSQLESDLESACLSLRLFLHSDTVALIKSNTWKEPPAQLIVCYPGTNDVLLRVNGDGKLIRESQEPQNGEFWSDFIDKMDSLLPTTAAQAQLPIPKQRAPPSSQVPSESPSSLGNVWTSFIGKVKSVLPQPQAASKAKVPIPKQSAPPSCQVPQKSEDSLGPVCRANPLNDDAPGEPRQKQQQCSIKRMAILRNSQLLQQRQLSLTVPLLSYPVCPLST